MPNTYALLIQKLTVGRNNILHCSEFDLIWFQDSLTLIEALVDVSVKEAKTYDRFQFERNGLDEKIPPPIVLFLGQP